MKKIVKYCPRCFSTNLKPISLGRGGFLPNQYDCFGCNTRQIALEGETEDVEKMRKQFLKSQEKK